MIRSDAVELMERFETFRSGRDRTRAFVDEIEGLVIECCIDEPWFDDLSLALAQYSPGGGPMYFDADALLAQWLPVEALLREAVESGEYFDDGESFAEC